MCVGYCPTQFCHTLILGLCTFSMSLAGVFAMEAALGAAVIKAMSVVIDLDLLPSAVKTDELHSHCRERISEVLASRHGQCVLEKIREELGLRVPVAFSL